MSKTAYDYKKPEPAAGEVPGTLEEVWEDTKDVVKRCTEKDYSVVRAVQGSGKTYGALEVAAEKNTPTTYLVSRRDLYQQAQDIAKKVGFDASEISIIPSPFGDCPAFKGDGIPGEKGRCRQLYSSGWSAAEIHHRENLSCQPSCPYMDEYEGGQDDSRLLIGHYLQANRDALIEDRLVIIDEFPHDSFLTSFGRGYGTGYGLPRLVEAYLRDLGVPYSTHREIVKAMEDNPSDTREDVLSVLEESADGDDILAGYKSTCGSSGLQMNGYHRLAPLVIAGVVQAKPLDNGWYHFDTDSHQDQLGDVYGGRRYVVVGHQGSEHVAEQVHILHKVNLEAADSVVGLDATARETMWNTVFDHEFTVEEYIEGQQRLEYVRDLQDIEIWQSGGGAKFYSSGNRVAADDDPAVNMYLSLRRSNPHLITPKKAGEELQREAPDMFKKDLAPTKNGRGFLNFAEVRSNNELTDTDALHVLGCPHPGDSVIQLWGALQDESVSRADGSRGVEQRFEPEKVGQPILKFFTVDAVEQALMRARKDSPGDSGATVLISTQMTPEWLKPNENIDADDVPYSSEGRRNAVRYLRRCSRAKTSEVAEKARLESGRGFLMDLEEEDVIEKDHSSNCNLIQWVGYGNP